MAAAVGLALCLVALVAGPVAAATVTIRITDRLSPAELTVERGTTIRFVNASGERHRMRSQTGPADFDSGNLEPGESFSVRLSAAGTYSYLDERDDDNSRFFGRIVVRGASSGSGGSGGGSGGSGGGAGGASGGTSTAPATTASVGMADRTFGPATVTIAAGGTVTWRNDDDRPHTVTERGGGFDSGTLGSGATWKRSFPDAGTFAYLCLLHPEMTGTVVVKGSAVAPAPVAPHQPAPSPSPTATPAPEEPSTAAATTVEARDFAFEAPSIEVPVGAQVIWRNVGPAPHTVTAGDGSFDSGMIESGGTWSRTFDTAGIFDYLCAFHPDMVGTVRVATAAEPSGTASAQPTAPPAPTSTTPSEAPAAAAGGGSAGPGPGSGPIGTANVEAFARFGFAFVLVLAGAVLFGRTIRSSVRANG